MILEVGSVVGDVGLMAGGRLTQELLADLESLLIRWEQPWANIQGRRTEFLRPGMVVRCTGPSPGRPTTGMISAPVAATSSFDLLPLRRQFMSCNPGFAGRHSRVDRAERIEVREVTEIKVLSPAA
jgi:hypothetical protein